MPVATKLLVRPSTTVVVTGVTAIALKVAVVTVKVPKPDLVSKVAVISADPVDTPVATPVVDRTVATGVLSELQATRLVMSTVLSSE